MSIICKWSTLVMMAVEVSLLEVGNKITVDDKITGGDEILDGDKNIVGD